LKRLACEGLEDRLSLRDGARKRISGRRIGGKRGIQDEIELSERKVLKKRREEELAD